MGQATGISEVCDSCVIDSPEGVGPGVVMQSWVRLLHDRQSALDNALNDITLTS